MNYIIIIIIIIIAKEMINYNCYGAILLTFNL